MMISGPQKTLSSDIKEIFSYGPIIEKDPYYSRPKVRPQESCGQIAKALSYIPILGTVMFVGNAIVVDNPRDKMFLLGRATLALLPPILMVVDLVVTIVDVYLIKKRCRELRLLDQQASLKINSRFANNAIDASDAGDSAFSQESFSILRKYLLKASRQDALMQASIPSDDDEKKWIYFLKKFVCHSHHFHDLFKKVIQNSHNQEALLLLLKGSNPANLSLAMEAESDFSFTFEDKVIHTHQLILRKLEGPYFTALNSSISYLNLTSVDLPEEDFRGFYRAYYSFILGKRVHITKKNFQSYLSIAEKYGFGQLKKDIENWIWDKLDSFDPKQLFELADLYRFEPIKEALVESVFSKKAGQCINQIKNISSKDRKLLQSWLPRVERLAVKSLVADGDVKSFIEYLQLCPNLREIRLWTNSAKALNALKSLNKLEQVELFLESGLSTADLNSLKDLPVTTLSMARWKLSSDHFRLMSGLPLKNLILSKSILSMSELDQLRALELLQLDLSKTWLKDDDVIDHLASLSVSDLNLSETQVTWRCLVALAGMSLKFLNLKKTVITEEDCLGADFQDTEIAFDDQILEEYNPHVRRSL
ncbi:MAG: BTB/POZ domain-containing protein [Parachlamydiaceae bacterium]